MNSSRLIVGDSEAQKAVEALLALTSSNQFSFSQDEEEDKIINEGSVKADSIANNADLATNSTTRSAANEKLEQSAANCEIETTKLKNVHLNEEHQNVKGNNTKADAIIDLNNSKNSNDLSGKSYIPSNGSTKEIDASLLQREAFSLLEKSTISDGTCPEEKDNPVPVIESTVNNDEISNLKVVSLKILSNDLKRPLAKVPVKYADKTKKFNDGTDTINMSNGNILDDNPNKSQILETKTTSLVKSISYDKLTEDKVSKTSKQTKKRPLKSPLGRNFGLKNYGKTLKTDIIGTLKMPTTYNKSPMKKVIPMPKSMTNSTFKLNNCKKLKSPVKKLEFSSKEQDENNSCLNESLAPNKYTIIKSLQNEQRHVEMDTHLTKSCKTNAEKSLKVKSSKPTCKESPSNSFMKEVANAIAEDLPANKLGQLTPLQACQLSLLIQKENETATESVKLEPANESVTSNSNEVCMMNIKEEPVHQLTEKQHTSFSLEADDTIPIQAEVVMSEGSESEKEDQTLEEEVHSYLKSFISSDATAPLVEYPPKNNELPEDGTDLTAWQLDRVRLPRFTPLVNPPPWLRLTIPADGYCCNSCGDTFFIESSLVQHRERRSIWISLECGPCDAKLTFYNRCAFKDHIREHLLKGERVDEETVVVRSLPLQLTKLLQPIRVPVPESLRPAKSRDKSPQAKSPRSINEKENFLYSEPMSMFGCNASMEDAVSPENNKSPSKRLVRCYLCERMFYNVRELMTHMRTDQPWSDQRVECRKCLLVLPSVCAAKAHILTHPPAKSSSISVCPECGSRCDGPKDFVRHLNTCGHQFRRSGIMCIQCNVCFFKLTEDFVIHWIKEHCTKSYECIFCSIVFDTPLVHNCTTHQLNYGTFRGILACPLCKYVAHVSTKEDKDTALKIRNHLSEVHPNVVNRIYYVYKSKFCSNAFQSKDELRTHHDREHRRDNHYRTRNCNLHHEVLGFQQQYFNGQEPRHAFITIPVTLSDEELQEARSRDVPTVSSVIDKSLFPDEPPSTLDCVKMAPEDIKVEEMMEILKPNACYRCGYAYTDSKDCRRHKRLCEGKPSERTCLVCGAISLGEEFAKHCLRHIADGIILCMYCNGSQFSTYEELQQHFKIHVCDQFSYPVTCAFCSFVMSDNVLALNHLNVEHEPRPLPDAASDYECDRCGRRFHGERGLNVHMTRCTVGTATPAPAPPSGRQCHVCKKALTSETFGKHLVNHLEEGLLVCSLCDALTLPSSMALLLHLEEHSSSLAYPATCPMCQIQLAEAESALTHLKEDHGFGNISCPECDMHYNFTYQLQRHIEIVHKVCLYAKRRYICWICRAYDHVKKETLMNHFRTVHGLSKEEVDEKATIRTRGQGTMPTSQFIPTKPLGSKEKTNKNNKADDDCNSKHNLKVDSNQANQEKQEMESGDKLHLSDQEMETDVALNYEIKDELSKIDVEKTPSKTITSKKLERKSSKTGKQKTPRKSNPKKFLIKPSELFSNKTKATSEKKTSKEKENTSLKKRKKYRCRKCKFGTNVKNKYDRHIRSKHKRRQKECEEGFVCSECGESFVVEPSLVRHMFFAHKIKQPVSTAHSPPETSRELISPSEASKELLSIPESKNARCSEENDIDLQCCVCKEDFSSSVLLYSHLRTHGMAFLKIGRKKRNLCQ